MEAVSWVVIALLLAITGRRLLLLAGAMLGPRPVEESKEPTILVVVAARNEAWQAEPLLEALERLDYPVEKRFFVLVSDGSSDGTAQKFQRWCDARARAIVIELPENAGKSAAINLAMKAGPSTELVAVYDADQRPRPDSLRKLTRTFGEKRVGAASGYRLPSNADHGVVSRYAALETWVHQFVVMAGKDRWGLNPPTMGGNCIYRVTAIAEIGGFPNSSSGEDVEVSLGMIARGWQTRFCPDAVAESKIGETLGHYASQRIRWTYGMHGAGKHARSVEGVAVASAYADRLVFAAACGLAIGDQISPGWLAAYLGGPFMGIVVALARAGRLQRAPIYFLSAVPMFLFDIGCSAYATLLALARRRPAWQQPEEAATEATAASPQAPGGQRAESDFSDAR